MTTTSSLAPDPGALAGTTKESQEALRYTPATQWR